MATYDPTKCVMCFTVFVKGRRGYDRRRLKTLTSSPGTAFKFCQRTVYLDNYVCNKCASFFRKNTIKKGNKRVFPPPKKAPVSKGKDEGPKMPCPMSSSPPPPPPQKEAILNKEGHEGGTSESGPAASGETQLGSECQLPDVECGEGEKEDEVRKEQEVESDQPRNHIDRAIEYLEAYKYYAACRALSKGSLKARQAIIRAATDIIKSEIKAKPQLKAFEQEVNVSTIASFSWEEAMDEASQSMPATVNCIWAMMPLKKNGENKSDLARKAGQMLSTALHANCGKYKFVWTSLGIELWKQRVNDKVFKTLNYMGVSQGVYAAKYNVDKIGIQHDQEFLKWKESQEEIRVPQEGNENERPPGYGLCIEHIQVASQAKPQSAVQSNTFMSQTMCFAVKDRVPQQPSKRQVSAVELDPYAFLPSPDVFERQRARAVFLVTRLLTKHLANLRHLGKKIPSRIVHAYTKEMDMKSECVTLGVVDADPGSTQGMMTVMEHLQKYVPVVEDAPMECLLHGAGLSAERIIHAQRARSNGEKWEDRLEGVRACPQEHHKELLHMQDANNKFFRASTLAERGTIAQMKHDFNHRSFKKDAIEGFQHVWDLYKFATEAHIILCAMKLCGVTSWYDELDGLPAKQKVKAQVKWLTNLAQRVVDFCWAPPARGDVQIAAAAYDDRAGDVSDEDLRYCYCGTSEKSDGMVRCCAKSCKYAWFHLSCAGLEEAPDFQTDWYCSADCEQDDSYIYCFCHQRSVEGESHMIQCHLQEDCKKYEWYHKSCVNLSEDDPVPDKWFCTEACELGAENDDEVLNHTKALMFDGLCNLIRREAVREGDGPAMVDDWRADMLGFYENNQIKYLIHGHFFLACVGGFVDPKLQVSYVWNRVANPHGTPGGNISLDLVKEFVNLDYAGLVKSCGGNLTPQQLTRCAQVSGPFGRGLDALFIGTGSVDTTEAYQARRADLYDTDIKRFTEEYQADALFDYVPGRQSSFKMDASCAVHNPRKLGQKLKRFSTKMDMWQNINGSSHEQMSWDNLNDCNDALSDRM